MGRIVRHGPRNADLAEFIDKQPRMLASSALAGGLVQARPRSSPQRLTVEVARFIRLLQLALGPRHKREIERLVLEEVRSGAFAGSSASEVSVAFSVWRRVLESFAAGLGEAVSRQRIIEVLDELERVLVERAGAYEAQRIDVIAIGASAGGIPALREVLQGLGEDLPVTVLVVLHVSPDAPSLLANILGRGTEMTIVPAVNFARLYLGYAYVASPGRHLVAEGDHLRLVNGPPVHFVKPSVDVLFESAAESYGPHLASVVLTGTGADGATGTRAVRGHGGVTVAQSPASAEFAGMPEAAIATGTIDYEIPLVRIGPYLRHLATAGRDAAAASA